MLIVIIIFSLIILKLKHTQFLNNLELTIIVYIGGRYYMSN